MAKKPKASNKKHFLLNTIFSTIFGAILGLYGVRWFVELLPGPSIPASVSRTQKGGCTFYSLDIGPDRYPDDTSISADYISARVQLPRRITDFKVGVVRGQTLNNGVIAGLQAWSLGRNDKSECAILQSTPNDTLDVQAASTGNTIVVHVSRLAPHEMITAVAVLSESESTVTSSPGVIMDGMIEYTKLGQVIQKSLPIRNDEMVQPR